MNEMPRIYWRPFDQTAVYTLLNPNFKKVLTPRINEEGFLFFPYQKGEKGYLIRGDHHKVEKTEFSVLKPGQEVKETASKEFYMSIVERAIKAISEKKVSKVVIARSHLQALPRDFDVNVFFKKLCATYKNAFVYGIEFENEIWIGASPEILLKKSGKHFQTYALAGTLRKSESKQFNEKEKHEQALVLEYIKRVLENNKVTDIDISKAERFEAGNLIHLINKISFAAQEPLNLIKGLHPTPAVCGLPLRAAQKFIDSSEPDKREFYSGYLGPVYKNQDFDLWVNLRCAKISEEGIRLFAGAGIVKNSDANLEWMETEQKMDTLRLLL